MRFDIYTDGACSQNPGYGGWAYVYNTDDGLKTKAGNDKHTTNNRMELTAVLNALCDIPSIGRKKDEFRIFSDSAYVVNSINNSWLPRWKMQGWVTRDGADIKNRDLWEKVYNQLNILANNKCFPVFIKVKGHAGNLLNEMADKLAQYQSKNAKYN